MKKAQKLYLAVKTREVKGELVQEFVLDSHDKPRIYLSIESLRKNVKEQFEYVCAYTLSEQINKADLPDNTNLPDDSEEK